MGRNLPSGCARRPGPFRGRAGPARAPAERGPSSAIGTASPGLQASAIPLQRAETPCPVLSFADGCSGAEAPCRSRHRLARDEKEGELHGPLFASGLDGQYMLALDITNDAL